MGSKLSSHLWITRYCKRAVQLTPDLTERTVVRRAVAAYPYAGDMPPETAVEMYAALSAVRSNASGRAPLADRSRRLRQRDER